MARCAYWRRRGRGDAARVARAAIDALTREGWRGSVAIVAAVTGEDVGEHDLPPPAAASGLA